MISGSRPYAMVVIIEFPSLEKEKAWRASPEMRKILPIRDASSQSRVYVVEEAAP